MTKPVKLSGDKQLLTVLGSYLDVRAVTTTAEVATTNDAGGLVSHSNASASTFTVNADSTTFDVPIGTRISVYQAGAGQVTITAGASVTIRKNAATLKMTGQYATVTLYKVAANTWVCHGELAAS